LNKLLDAESKSTPIPAAFDEHAANRPGVASRGRLDGARKAGRAREKLWAPRWMAGWPVSRDPSLTLERTAKKNMRA